MALDPRIARNLVLPAVCAPMFLVSTPDLVREACKAGIMGVLPRQNARTFEVFEDWLKSIRSALDLHKAKHPEAIVGPMAANLATNLPSDQVAAHLDVCRRYGVEIVISAVGNPTELAAQVHDWGGLLFHDVTSLKFAEKAISAGVDGLTCIGAGGGGHSGGVSPMVLVPKIREIYDGIVLMAGSISTGAGIRAAEVLGADLAYMGTRFIATQESNADPAYRAMIVEGVVDDLMFTGRIAGVPANWLIKSMERMGLDPKNLPVPTGRGMSHDHLPEGVKPWKNLWSAGQGIDLIHDVPSVATLVVRLREEYATACAKPNFAERALAQ